MLALSAACLAGALSSAAADASLLSQPSPASTKWRSLVQLSVARAGSRLVCAGERGFIALSDDHGVSWRQVKVPVSTALTRVAFVDAKAGWAVGHAGAVLKTSDGGEHWEKVYDGVMAAKAELEAATAEADGSVASRRRADEARRLVADGPDKPFLSMRFADAQHGVVVGAYGLAFETHDGGRTWQSLVGRLEAGQRRHFYAVQSSGDRTLFAGEQGVLLASRDGGRTFSTVTLPGKGTVFGLLQVNSTLVAYGLKGALYRSNDQGSTWEVISIPQVTLTAGLLLANGSLLLGNEAGQMFVSTDEGRTFTQVKIRNPEPITGLVEAADGAVVRAGPRGVRRVEMVAEEAKK